MDRCLQDEGIQVRYDLPVVEGMRAIDSFHLLIEIGLAIDERSCEEEPGAKTDPPGEGHIDAASSNDRFVDRKEAENDEHQARSNDSEDAQGFSVAMLMSHQVIH